MAVIQKVSGADTVTVTIGDDVVQIDHGARVVTVTSEDPDGIVIETSGAAKITASVTAKRQEPGS